MGKQRDRETERQRDRETERQRDRERQTRTAATVMSDDELGDGGVACDELLGLHYLLSDLLLQCSAEELQKKVCLARIAGIVVCGVDDVLEELGGLVGRPLLQCLISEHKGGQVSTDMHMVSTAKHRQAWSNLGLVCRR
jgi:hypothetical protein